MSHKISQSAVRIDSDDKCRGTARYIGDITFDHILYGRTVRSTRARAKIRTITFPDMPEGYYIIDASDIPGKNCVKMIQEDFPVFASDRVEYIGEPVLLVAGEDREEIDRIISGIEIDYEDLSPVTSIMEAESRDDALFIEYHVHKGEPATAFEQADKIIEATYETGCQEHIYLETQGMTGLFRDGRITVYGSLQCPYYVKPALVHAFGWEEERFRVVQTTTGGAFGGKEEFPSLVAIHAAVAAFKTGKPVKIIYDRDEDITASTKRHPSVIQFRTGFDTSGRISCMDIRVTLDGGAYEGLTSVVLQRAMFAVTGVYEIPNLTVHGRAFRTNTVPAGAFRGFGAPQAFFAVEMHMNHLAGYRGVDPLDFKRSYLYKKGSKTSTGGTIHHPVFLPEMIDRLISKTGYRKKIRKTRTSVSGYRYGIGCSLFLHGCGFTGSGEKDKIKGKVKLRGSPDGTVEILVANVEMGQGPSTTLRKIAAQAMGLPLDRIVYQNPDTDRVPDSGPTVASRTAMVVGYMVLEGAERLKGTWNGKEEKTVEVRYHHPDFVSWDQEQLSGDAYPAYSWGVNIAEVRVDVLTGEIRVDRIHGIYDIGTVLDELIARGQMEGGIAQGAGWATIEVMEQEKGRLKQCSMTDYVIPTALDVPSISVEFLENRPYELGPFGAKGAGEIPLVGAPPAVAAAVEHALGTPVYRIPIKPEHIIQGLHDED